MAPVGCSCQKKSKSKEGSHMDAVRARTCSVGTAQYRAAGRPDDGAERYPICQERRSWQDGMGAEHEGGTLHSGLFAQGCQARLVPRACQRCISRQSLSHISAHYIRAVWRCTTVSTHSITQPAHTVRLLWPACRAQLGGDRELSPASTPHLPLPQR